MVSKVDKNVSFEVLGVDESFDAVNAETYIPSSATSRKSPMIMKQYVFIDGEGVNHDGPAKPQSYVLLGASTGERIKAWQLSSNQCFEFLIQLKINHPNSLYVVFGMGYDANQWVADIPVKRVKERIMKAKRTQWGKWTVLYMPGKIFQLTDRERKLTVVVTDVSSFFENAKFSEACMMFMAKEPDKVAIIEEVEKGKAERDSFLWSEVDTLVEPYMTKELILGVDLMNRLRYHLMEAGIRPRGWHGPGAIASALIHREGIKQVMRKPDRNLTEWARRAYFGGRFEQLKTGYLEKPVYQYDVNSAYPYALTMCPNLSQGTWEFRKEPTDSSLFKIYALRYKNYKNPLTGWNPLPARTAGKAVLYQAHVHGYYWGPEAEVVLRLFPDVVEIAGVYEFYDSGERPFAFIHEMYDQRQIWKAEGNPTQFANKVGMNSLYGKFAQRVGWDEVNMTGPPSHQLEYAGFCTSMCRSMILEAMAQSESLGHSPLALETDAIFSTVQLDLPISKKIGEFSEEKYDGILYVQNGVYYKHDSVKGWLPGKTRGFKKNSIPIEVALQSVETLEPLKSIANRFQGMAYADKPTWRAWTPHEHKVQWGGAGKRFHFKEECSGCTSGSHWHDTIWRQGDPISQPHSLPWLDGGTLNVFQEDADYDEGFEDE